MPETITSQGPKSVSEILNAAADLLEKPGAWTQEALARDDHGAELEGAYRLDVAKKGSCWCLEGALIASSNGDCGLVHRGIMAVRNVVRRTPYAWNDAPGRTQAEVVAALRAAASKSESSNV